MEKRLIICLATAQVKFFNKETLDLENIDFHLIIDESEKKQLERIDPTFLHNVHIIGDSYMEGKLVGFNYEPTKEAVESILKANSEIRCVDIITANELNILIAERLIEEFHLPHPRDYATLIKYRDKMVMKKAVLEHSLSAPKYIHICSDQAENLPEYYQHLVNELKIPFIVKPPAAAGCAGVEKISQFDDFYSWYHKVDFANYSFEAEEYITGKLYHCDQAIKNGKIIFSGCGEYNQPLLESIKNRAINGTMILSEQDPRHRLLSEFSKKVLNAIGLIDGVTHMEIFITHDGQPVFLEVGARPPGGYINKAYEIAYGINLMNWYLKILSDIDFDTHYEHKKHVFWGFIPAITGTVKALQEPVNLKSNYLINWEVKLGDKLNIDGDSILENAGVILGKNEKYDIVTDDFKSLKELSLLVVE